MAAVMPTIISGVVVPVDLAPAPVLPIDVTERLWLDWAKIAWFEKGPEAGVAVLAYFIALRDGGTATVPTGKA